MKHSCRLILIGSVMAFVSAGSARAVTPAASSRHESKPRQGFLDYALGKINPSDKDYGSLAASARDGIVANTIQTLYFWSNIVSLVLLSGTSTAFVLVLRTQDKRELIAATLISQLWNGRVVDRREILQRTSRYNALVDARNGALTQIPAQDEESSHRSPISDQSVQRQQGTNTRVQTEAAAPKKPPSGGATVGTSSSELEQRSRLLEGQNQALRNSERNLRERLNQVSQDLEQERRRNQALKGA